MDLDERKIVNKRIVICKNGHKFHETAYMYEDQYKIKHYPRDIRKWTCPICKAEKSSIELVMMVRVTEQQAYEVGRSAKRD